MNSFFSAFGHFRGGGTFTPGERQVLLLSNAVANDCAWAVAFHSLEALTDGVTPAAVDAIRRRELPADPRLAALSTLTRALIEKRGHLDETDAKAFTAAGFGDGPPRRPCRSGTCPSSRPAVRTPVAAWCSSSPRSSTCRSANATPCCSAPGSPRSIRSPHWILLRSPRYKAPSRPSSQQEPYPALVMDRGWDIQQTNAAAVRFFAFLREGHTASPPVPANVLRRMFHLDGVRRQVTNWPEVAEALVRCVRREAIGGVADERAQRILDEVLAYPDVPASLRSLDVSAPRLPSVPIRYASGDRRFDYFSTVMTPGTPQDVTLQELRTECFFPMNDETRGHAYQLRFAGSATPA